MNGDATSDVHESDKPGHQRLTTAGRLLQLLASDGATDLTLLARRLGIPTRRLRACRDGEQPLEPEVQMLLAALVLEISPEHASLARQLHAQAQSALRVREGLVVSHPTYNGRRWR
jgi:hypothetical protein